MNSLLEPMTAGDLHLKNRVWMAPLTRCRAGEGRVPTALMAEYYRQRAGAGLIISEAIAIAPIGVGYPDTPGLWSKEQVEGWARVTEAVHAAGGKIVAQLWHVGRISDPIYHDGELPVAPSPIAAEGHVRRVRPQRPHAVPRPLAFDEIAQTVDLYRVAAQNAKSAGFDGVEIHGANGYLPNQFLSSASNLRTDSYGGSVENRARFALEAVDAAIEVWGAGRVGLHISPGDYEHSVADPGNAEAYRYLASEVAKRKIAFVCAREALDEEGKLGPDLKKLFGCAYIANQSISPEEGVAALERGDADGIAFGRLFISNPDLAERIEVDAPLNEPEPETYYASPGRPDEVGYTDYPRLSA